MPIVPFSTYTLNNDNAECGYILVFDCTLANFVFMNPCDLIAGCHINVNDLIDRDTFDRCQIVNSPLVSGMLPLYVLRVNAAGDCIEGVDVTTIITPALFDYMVKVDAVDTPDYLEAQIIGTLNRIIITKVAGQLVVNIDPAFGNTLPANPVCVDPTFNPTGYAQLVYDNMSGVHWECQQNRFDAFRYNRFLTNDTVFQSGIHPAFVVGGTVGGACYWYVPCVGGEGMATMSTLLPGNIDGMGFNAIIPNTEIPAIRIQQTGLYAVWANVDCKIDGGAGVRAIRFFLYTNNSKRMVVNLKQGVDTISIIPAGSTSLTLNFSGYNYVMLNEGEYVFMGIRAYTPGADPFTITILSEAFTLAAPFLPGPSGNLCGTTFGCALVSKSLQNST